MRKRQCVICIRNRHLQLRKCNFLRWKPAVTQNRALLSGLIIVARDDLRFQASIASSKPLAARQAEVSELKSYERVPTHLSDGRHVELFTCLLPIGLSHGPYTSATC